MIRIIALTDAGYQIGSILQDQLQGSEFWFKPKPFSKKIRQAFCRGDRLILICATGIVVRTLAPVLDSKHNDPAVLVLDEAGEFVIPLLSGHEGGANEWAYEIAAKLEAQAVLTTANPYLAPIFCVGMGCERGCPEDHLKRLLDSCLRQADLLIEHISSINSIAIKSNEVSLISLCKRLNVEYKTWDAEALRRVEAQLSQRSDIVFNSVGVYGVAESAALFSAQQQTLQAAELVLTKQKTNRATCAIARSYPNRPTKAGS